MKKLKQSVVKIHMTIKMGKGTRELYSTYTFIIMKIRDFYI